MKKTVFVIGKNDRPAVIGRGEKTAVIVIGNVRYEIKTGGNNGKNNIHRNMDKR